MINIAFLVHGLQAGGIERSVTRIVNGLDRDEFLPSIICLDKTGPAENWLERDVPVIEIGKQHGNDFMAVRRLANTLRELHIDIIQSHNWGTLVEAVIARKLSRTRFHIHAERGTVMGMVDARGVRHWLRARAMSIALGRVDRVVSNSRTVAARVYQRCGYSEKQITIIPNGVPGLAIENRREVRHQVRTQLNLQPDSVLIGSVGRLVEVKGFDLAISAFAEVLSKSQNTHFVLVGDGPEREPLSRLAEDLGVSHRLSLVGHQDDVGKWLVAMDIYFNSSRSEGMSQSIIEAMAAGLPIVATDVGDSAGVVGQSHQASGICVSANDVSQLAAALVRLAADPSLRQSLAAQSARRHGSLFSELQLTQNCEALYHDLFSNDRVRVLN